MEIKHVNIGEDKNGNQASENVKSSETLKGKMVTNEVPTENPSEGKNGKQQSAYGNSPDEIYRWKSIGVCVHHA